jgi:hypothetical protein
MPGYRELMEAAGSSPARGQLLRLPAAQINRSITGRPSARGSED